MTQEIYDAIVAYYRAFGAGPTVRELMRAMGLRSTNTVAYHLRKLHLAGLLVPSRPGQYVPAEILEYLKKFTPKNKESQ
jgi:SOS-response transcriptional repressor LexA